MTPSTARSSERTRQPGGRRRADAAADPGVRDEQPQRSRKGIATRARLIAAAKLVFERDGFLEARIVDIAETGQLAPGSFYHYFDSKEQIFLEVAEAQEERLTARGEDAPIAPEEDSPWERIRRANRRYLLRYRDEAALMGVIEQVSRYDELVNAARMNTMKHFVERAEKAISRLQREGAADPRLNPALAADALGAMVGRFAELWMVQGYRDYDFDEAVDQLTVLWGNALGMSPEPSAVQPAKRRAKQAQGSGRAAPVKRTRRA